MKKQQNFAMYKHTFYQIKLATSAFQFPIIMGKFGLGERNEAENITNIILPRKFNVYSKYLLSTTQQMTVQIDITDG